MSAAGAVWAEAFRVERRGVDLRAGLAGAIATCAPLAIGVAANEPEIGVTACFGGLNGALAVPRGTLRERLGWGAGASLGCCGSVAVATLAQDSVAASAIAAFALVGLAAFLRTFGPNGGLTGFVIGAIFVITNGIPAGSLDVGERVLWFGLGSLAGLVLMVAAYAREAPPAGQEPPPKEALGGAAQLGRALGGRRFFFRAEVDELGPRRQARRAQQDAQLAARFLLAVGGEFAALDRLPWSHLEFIRPRRHAGSPPSQSRRGHHIGFCSAAKRVATAAGRRRMRASQADSFGASCSSLCPAGARSR